MQNLHKIITRISQAGLRCTNGRINVLRSLLSSNDPLTHQQVFRFLADTGIHRVTVYRILQSLVDGGLVHRIEAGDRVWRYAICDCWESIHCHPHFTCRTCGKVECLREMELPNLANIRPGYFVEHHEMYIHGVCPVCLEIGS